MGNSHYFDELIVSYLSKELDSEEEAFVLDWINSSEQNKQYFEELSSLWNLLEAKQSVKNIDIDNEWKHFEQEISAKSVEIVGSEAETFLDFEKDNKQNRKSKSYRYFVSAAVAATIVLVFAIGWRLAFDDAANKKQPEVSDYRQKSSPAPFIRHRINSTKKVQQLILQDGSVVKLYGRSEISYPEPFIENKREIKLAGKATFQVAKDETRPFTVITGNISTTALGTKFTVTAFENTEKFIVRLFEGKVVIKSPASTQRKLIKDFYLFPQHELVYDNKHLTGKIRKFAFNNNLLAAKKKNKKETFQIDHPSVPNLGKETWFMFNNQPLGQVFNQLEEMFKVDIVFSKKDVAKSYFIGAFHMSDSLDEILKQIAIVNNLKVTKNNNQIFISKYDGRK